MAVDHILDPQLLGVGPGIHPMHKGAPTYKLDLDEAPGAFDPVKMPAIGQLPVHRKINRLQWQVCWAIFRHGPVP